MLADEVDRSIQTKPAAKVLDKMVDLKKRLGDVSMEWSQDAQGLRSKFALDVSNREGNLSLLDQQQIKDTLEMDRQQSEERVQQDRTSKKN